MVGAAVVLVALLQGFTLGQDQTTARAGHHFLGDERRSRIRTVLLSLFLLFFRRAIQPLLLAPDVVGDDQNDENE